MIKPGALVMAALMAGVAAGTYYGLDFLPAGVLPRTLGRTPPPPPPKVGATEGIVVAAVPLTASDAPPEPATQEPSEQDVTEEPPPPSVSSSPAPAPEASSPAPAQAAAPKPAPSKTPKAAPPAETAAAPAPAAPAASPAPAPQASATPKKSAPKPAPKTQTANAAEPDTVGPVKPKPPEADALKPWWPDPAKIPATQLKLQYAGQVQGQQAIALLFSAPLNVDSVKQYVAVRTIEGVNVAGQWEVGQNPRLVVFRGVKPGRYTVILSPEVADQKGFMLGMKLQGPVYIQP